MRLNLEALESSERLYEVAGSRATTEFKADMVALVGGAIDFSSPRIVEPRPGGTRNEMVNGPQARLPACGLEAGEDWRRGASAPCLASTLSGPHPSPRCHCVFTNLIGD